MAYDPTFPADDEYLSEFPAGQREQIRAIVEDTIVNALKLCGLSPGNASGNIPKSNGTRCVNLNADMLDGHDATYFSADGHTHSAATTSSNGFMSNTDKTKLNGIATGAEVNQNAFANVKVGSTTIQADAKQDTLEMAAGSNIALTPDATNDKVTVAFSGVLPVANGGTGQSDLANVTVGSATKDGSGNNIADTYFPKSGDTVAGDLQLNGYLKSEGNASASKIIFIRYKSYHDSGFNDDTNFTNYIKNLLKWTCANYPGKSNTIFVGCANPSGQSFIIFHIYNTSAVDANGIPQYASGLYNGGYNFNSTNYVVSTNALITNGNIASNIPAATSSALGGVITGSNITNNSGEISITSSNVTTALGYTPLSTTAGVSSGSVEDKNEVKRSLAFGSGTSTLKIFEADVASDTSVFIEVCSGLSGTPSTHAFYVLRAFNRVINGFHCFGDIGATIGNKIAAAVSGTTLTIYYTRGSYEKLSFRIVVVPDSATINRSPIGGAGTIPSGAVYPSNSLTPNIINQASMSANGYVKFGNGLIIQWGVQTAPTTETSYSVTFPVSFAEACYSMNVSTDLSTHGTSVQYAFANIHPQVFSVSKTGATLFSQHSQDSTGQASRAYWMAIGK